MPNRRLVSAINSFLYEWTINNWMGLNPEHRPFSSGSYLGLIAMLRVSIPEIGIARSSLVAEAIRQAGYEIVEDARGVYLREDTTPKSSTSAQRGDGQRSTSNPAAASVLNS